ncbi:MAG: hypothetical protein AAGI71_05175 [Bacteroidota bacterium]
MIPEILAALDATTQALTRALDEEDTPRVRLLVRSRAAVLDRLRQQDPPTDPAVHAQIQRLAQEAEGVLGRLQTRFAGLERDLADLQRRRTAHRHYQGTAPPRRHADVQG